MSRNKYAVARRSIWYVLKKLAIIVAVLIACYGTFVEGMYISNIYIIVTEGMELRAECILQDASVLDLTEYFNESLVNSDPAINGGRYDNFTVSNFDYRLSLEKLDVLPWKNTATVRATERMASISATPNDEAAEGEAAAELPAWESVRYDIKLVKLDTRWYIDALEVVETNPQQEAMPTPDYSKLEEPAQ